MQVLSLGVHAPPESTRYRDGDAGTHRERVHHHGRRGSRALSGRKAIVWIARAISYLVYFYLIVVEIILFIGVLLFGANPSAGRLAADATPPSPPIPAPPPV